MSSAAVVRVGESQWGASCWCGFRGELVGCRGCAEIDAFNHECARGVGSVIHDHDVKSAAAVQETQQ